MNPDTWVWDPGRWRGPGEVSSLQFDRVRTILSTADTRMVDMMSPLNWKAY